MRAEGAPVKTISPARSKADQRRRRLRRGIARWEFDRQLCAEPTRRVARITLTLPAGDPQMAIGLVREFWRRVRQRFIGTRYFCWLELTLRGQAHYHCVWLNPPHQRRVNLLKFVDQAWGAGRTQVRFSDGSHGLQSELDYALSYAKKIGKKSYQQRYDEAPRELRTFMSQRLEIPPGRIDPHLDQEVWVWRPQEVYLGQEVPERLVYMGRVDHVVPRPGRCTALDWRRPRPGSRGSPRRAAPADRGAPPFKDGP